jgi:hypothetical protein
VKRTGARKPEIAHFDHPCVLLVDMPGFDESAVTLSELLSQAERADLIKWVASDSSAAHY